MVGTIEFDEPGDDSEPMTLDELRDSARRVLGVDLPVEPPPGPGPHALRRIAGQNTSQADRYRAGNIFLVGDSAHVHSAMGGPGLNLGMQDAVNLGWKLAATVNGWAPADLLDTYQSERYPVGERVMMQSMSQTALFGPGPEIAALRKLFNELLQQPSVAEHMAHLLAGSDVRYDVGDDHPLVGSVRARRHPRRWATGSRIAARRSSRATRLYPAGAWVKPCADWARPRRRRRRCHRRLRGPRAVDPARRLRRLGGRHFRGRRREPIARRAAAMVRCQPRRARRSTPGWRAIFGPSRRANSVMASHGRR